MTTITATLTYTRRCVHACMRAFFSRGCVFLEIQDVAVALDTVTKRSDPGKPDKGWAGTAVGRIGPVPISNFRLDGITVVGDETEVRFVIEKLLLLV